MHFAPELLLRKFELPIPESIIKTNDEAQEELKTAYKQNQKTCAMIRYSKSNQTFYCLSYDGVDFKTASLGYSVPIVGKMICEYIDKKFNFINSPSELTYFYGNREKTAVDKNFLTSITIRASNISQVFNDAFNTDELKQYVLLRYSEKSDEIQLFFSDSASKKPGYICIGKGSQIEINHIESFKAHGWTFLNEDIINSLLNERSSTENKITINL